MLEGVTLYVTSRDGQVAYQARGSGPTVALVTGTLAGTAALDEPLTRTFYERVASFCRLVAIDARGCGRSDPLPGRAPTVWEQADDLRAVLDDADCDRAVIWGNHAGGAVGVAFAVRYPERVQGLFITNGWARLIRADDVPFGITPEFSEQFIEAHGKHFGTGMFTDIFSPSRAGDPAVKAYYLRLEQYDASRSQAMLLTRMAQELDVRDVLARVNTPTVVMHTRDNKAIPAAHGRYLAEHIPGARLVEFAGTDHAFALEDPEPMLIELEAFVTDNRPSARLDTEFSTVVFADLVTSTARQAQIGDRRWRELIDDYERDVTAQTERHGGRVVKTTGDGILAVFPVPSRALRAAAAVAEVSRRAGLQSRVGIHAGEVQLRSSDVSGIVVNIAARVCALAGPAEVLVTRTVKDLLAGSTNLSFTDKGSHDLKGIADPWQLYRVD